MKPVLLFIVQPCLLLLFSLGAAARAAEPDSDPKLERLLKQLKSADAKEREQAARELNARPFLEKESTVAALLQAFEDTSPIVRRQAILSLAELETADKKVMAAFQKASKDEQIAVQLAAHAALWKFTKTEDSLTQITQSLKDPSPEVRREGITILGVYAISKKNVTAMMPILLNDPDKDVRYKAAEAINTLCHALHGEAKEAVPALMQLIESDDDYLRVNVLGALGEIGPEAKAAIPQIIKALKKHQSMAALALGKIGSDGKTVVPALVEALAEKDFSDRMNSAYALGIIGPDAKAAVPALQKIVEDRHISVRVAAQMAIWRATGDEKQLQAAITEAEKNPATLANSFVWMVSLGPAGQSVLVDCFKHASADVREMAVLALSTSGDPLPKQTVPALVEMVKDPNPKVREAVAGLLRTLDPAAARKAGIK